MKSSEIKAVKHSDSDIVKIISGGVVLWDNLANVVVVGDYKGLHADKVKKIIEESSKYRVIAALDYSNYDGTIINARRDLIYRTPRPIRPNRKFIVLTANKGWVTGVHYAAYNRFYWPYHLLEPEILNELPVIAQQNLFGLIQSSGVDIAGFKDAAKYMKELREKS